MDTPTEAYIVAIGYKDGKRWVKRFPLNVSLDLARGRYEDLSDLEVRETIKDFEAEQERREKRTQRRAEIAERTGGWNPFSAIRNAA